MTQSLNASGYTVRTDSALPFPYFKVSTVRHVVRIPRSLTAFQYLWITANAIVIVLGGNHLPNSASAADLVASSLAQNSAVVTPIRDYRTRRTLRLILEADPTKGISFN
jgi:hypothetical protein